MNTIKLMSLLPQYVLVVITLTVLARGHKNVKVNRNRVHADNVVHIPTEQIHLRDSGLENFVDINKNEPVNVLHVEKFVQNKEHVKQHMGSIDFNLDTASVAELDFHFFQIHDVDGNKALDGIELLEAVMHGLEEQFEDIEDDEEINEQEKREESQILFQSAYRSVDRVLVDDDINRDGYISVSEFLKSRRLTNVIRDAHDESY